MTEVVSGGIFHVDSSAIVGTCDGMSPLFAGFATSAVLMGATFVGTGTEGAGGAAILATASPNAMRR